MVYFVFHKIELLWINVDLDLFYSKILFCNKGFSKEIGENSGLFLETIEACGLKVGGCRQQIMLMPVYESSRSMSFLDIGTRSFAYEN